LRLTFHRLPDTDLPLPTAQNAEIYEKDTIRKFEKRLAASFMDVDSVAKEAGKEMASDLNNLLLKYIPVAALMLAGLTFLVNFATLKLANWTTPSEMVLTRAKLLTADAEKKTEDVQRENADLKAQISVLKADVEALKKSGGTKPPGGH
jgi:hypothetical protein